MVIYFSGTGNSVYVAEAIADRLQDEAVSANTYMKTGEKACFRSDRPWVFVFPIYISSMASLFSRFLRESEFAGERRAYFVATCASAMGVAPNIGEEICREKQLTFMGAEKVVMPQNYIALFTMTPPEEIASRRERALLAADRIAETIAAGRPLDRTLQSKAETSMCVWTEKLYNAYFTKTDAFYTTDGCIGCGMCERVCPLNNVVLKDGRPQWGKNCVHCMACINHCPKAAIEYGKKTVGKTRYVCRKYRAEKSPEPIGRTDGAEEKREDRTMKVLLAGAYGHLGSDILRALCAAEENYEIVATGRSPKTLEGLDSSRYTFRKMDATDPESVKGVCDGVDIVITTIGLTGASTKYTNYDIDYMGNLNLLREAQRAGVKHFAYISVINADKGEGIPMVHCKYMLEQELLRSGLDYVIYRPTGYFYDIAHVFWPMIKTKSVQLLKCKKEPVANVIDTRDFAAFILQTMQQSRKLYNVGGPETYTYRQIAEMFYNADGVTNGPVKVVPAFMMDILPKLPKIRKEGKADVIRFSKFTLTNDCYGDTIVPGRSFKEYIAARSYAEKIEKEKGLK